MQKFKQILWVYALASVAYGIFALLLLFPVHPISSTGWAIWFATALPIAVIGEAVGTVLFNNRTGLAIDDDPDRISMTRIAYGIVVAIVLMVATLYMATEFDWMSDGFWDLHFSRNW